TNNGELSVSDVNVSDKLPDGLTFISSNDTNYNNDTGIWTIGGINSGESLSLNIVVNTSKVGNFTNFASLFGVYSNVGVNSSNVTIEVSDLKPKPEKKDDFNFGGDYRRLLITGLPWILLLFLVIGSMYFYKQKK
ncbi:MAG: DUF11 domain-containing protein, partial [Methanobrevibacter sp.]|nr:DUF11 domain-containing protein [Methanobrevibacter sp.]